MNTTEVIFDLEDEAYAVHFKHEDYYVYFDVYPIELWDEIKNNTQIYNYVDKNYSMVAEFHKDFCLKKLSGSFGWRGVWQGRLYFTDDEYWGDELSTLNFLYTEKIIPWCKVKIKSNDTERLIFEN